MALALSSFSLHLPPHLDTQASDAGDFPRYLLCHVLLTFHLVQVTTSEPGDLQGALQYEALKEKNQVLKMLFTPHYSTLCTIRTR